jgi:hypothetical protein
MIEDEVNLPPIYPLSLYLVGRRNSRIIVPFLSLHSSPSYLTARSILASQLPVGTVSSFILQAADSQFFRRKQKGSTQMSTVEVTASSDYAPEQGAICADSLRLELIISGSF